MYRITLSLADRMVYRVKKGSITIAQVCPEAGPHIKVPQTPWESIMHATGIIYILWAIARLTAFWHF